MQMSATRAIAIVLLSVSGIITGSSYAAPQVSDQRISWIGDQELRELLFDRRVYRSMDGHILSNDTYETFRRDGQYRSYSDDGRVVGQYKITGTTICIDTPVKEYNRCLKIGKKGNAIIIAALSLSHEYPVIIK